MSQDYKKKSIPIDDRYKDGKGSFSSAHSKNDHAEEGQLNGDPNKESGKLDALDPSNSTKKNGWRDKVTDGNKSSAIKVANPVARVGNAFTGLSKKKKAGMIGGGVGGGFLIFLFIMMGPASLLGSLTQAINMTNDSSSHVLNRRFSKKFYDMVEKTSHKENIVCSVAKCKKGQLSNKAIKNLGKKGISAIADGEIYSPKSARGFPDKAITHYKIDGETVSAKDLKKFLQNSPKHASKLLGVKGAFNLRFRAWTGKYVSSKFFKKLGINKAAGIVKTLSKPFKSAADKIKMTKAAIKEVVPALSKMPGVSAAMGSLKPLEKLMTKSSKKGGLALATGVALCAVTKAPSIIGGAAAGFELLQLTKLFNDTLASPGSLSMAAGMYDKEKDGVEFTSEAADALGSALTEKDENGKSALDSKFLLSATGANTAKTGVSTEFAPGYSVLTNPVLSAIDGVGDIGVIKNSCNFLLSPLGMNMAILVGKGLGPGAAIIVVGEIVGKALAATGLPAKAVQVIGGWAVDLALNSLLEKDKLEGIKGEKYGDAIGVAAKAYYSSQGMSRNLPVLSEKTAEEFAQIRQESEDEERRIDIASHSPFDASNRHTFVGSIYNNAKLAMVKNGGLSSNLFNRLIAFAKIPTTFASMSASKVGATSKTGANDCGYAEYFNMTGDTPAETPAINAAGLPCVGISELQANMSSARAEALLGEDGRNWLKQDAEYSEDSTVEEYLDAVIGVNDDDWDSPLKDNYLSCGDASTGSYFYESAGCISLDNYKSGQAQVSDDLTGQVAYKDEDGMETTVAQSGDLGTANSKASLATDAEALAAINVFLIDSQIEGIVNGNDDQEPGQSSGGGKGFVNTDGFAFPIKASKGEDVSKFIPCTDLVLGCHYGPGTHHAFDLIVEPGRPVYAIEDGEIYRQSYRKGPYGDAPSQCRQIVFRGKSGGEYWYGHIQNTKFNQGDTVKAGDQIAEVGIHGCDDWSVPHLHIDKGKEYGMAGGGSKRPETLDPSFTVLMNKLYEELP